LLSKFNGENNNFGVVWNCTMPVPVAEANGLKKSGSTESILVLLPVTVPITYEVPVPVKPAEPEVVTFPWTVRLPLSVTVELPEFEIFP
jgi:hypothetical protein